MKNSKLAVLFLHHKNDEIIRHNYNLLLKYNPDVDIYPVGFRWHSLMENSHIVDRYEEFPNNHLLNSILNSGTSSESDLYLYHFFLHHQDYDAYFLVEWDTYCNCSIFEYYNEAMNKYDHFCSQMMTNEFYGPGTGIEQNQDKLDINLSDSRYIRRGSWYRYFFKHLNEPTRQKKLLPYLGSASTTSLQFFKKDVVNKITNLVLEDPRLYDNIQNEMRLGTLIQCAGYQLNEFGSDKNHFKEEDNYKPNIYNNIKGYYHPIKYIIDERKILK